MKLFNNLTLAIREKKQEKYMGLILLPDTKYVAAKTCLVLESHKWRLKEATIDSELSLGDRALVHQADGLEVKAWKDMIFSLKTKPNFDRLPQTVELRQVDEEWELKIKKGTMLVAIFPDDCKALVPSDIDVSDQ